MEITNYYKGFDDKLKLKVNIKNATITKALDELGILRSNVYAGGKYKIITIIFKVDKELHQYNIAYIDGKTVMLYGKDKKLIYKGKDLETLKRELEKLKNRFSIVPLVNYEEVEDDE